jgi:hypothetical protein
MRPQCCPVVFSPFRNGFGIMRRRSMVIKNLPLISKISALAIRRLARIVMLDKSKVDLNLDRREMIERDVIALWLSCI